ncbi:MAG: hypothetical protein KGI50_02865 [Patescibacteria group bacterium]|nr:hypothetical protein [Patescibacteria group bacterium]MDE2438551.1 hypothetical protein [Patescibacteria group bacterium]
MTSQEKLAKILRADKDSIINVEQRLASLTGKHGVIDRIMEENAACMQDRLMKLGVARDEPAKVIYDALISKIESDDHNVFKALGSPVACNPEDCAKLLNLAQSIASVETGFFLKEEKAREFLKQQPPQKVLAYLNYHSVEEMLAHEDLYEVYSALRFIEGSEWLNTIFFKQYEALTPDDFEERAIKVRTLGERWSKAAGAFVAKKWHNISHLKELGVVFIIPIALDISGEILRTLSLIFHYLHEIPFYADLFKKNANVPTTFSQNLISLLRGDVMDRRMQEGTKSLWLVVQRYLAKDDENDWRLFVPHLNPEALHWVKAERSLARIGELHPEFDHSLGFWEDLDWVGDYFKDDVGDDILVSFDLVDTVMSLVQEKEMIKYLYHHQEALWNKIFSEYFSLGELEIFAREYLLQGFFEL